MLANCGRGVLRWRPVCFSYLRASSTSQEHNVVAKSRVSNLRICPGLKKRQFTSCAQSEEDFKLVYTGPLNGAVRAIKMFSLSTAVASLVGSPVLVAYGSVAVPLAARVAMSSIVLTIGLSTTLILHWIAKAYVTQLFYNPATQTVAAHTLNLFGRTKRNEFHVSEARPPTQLTAFTTFQARGKSYFLHSEGLEDKGLLTSLLGAYSVLETADPYASKNTLFKQYAKKTNNLVNK